MEDLKIKSMKKKPYSWSQLSKFEWSKSDWYNRYVLGIKDPPSPAMLFGKHVGEIYDYGPSFTKEYKLEAKVGTVSLIGYIDAFDLENKVLKELKTGKKWDYKKASTHGQIDLYCAMLYMMHKIKPEDLTIELIWLETQENVDGTTTFVPDMKPVVFKVEKTMADIVRILAWVNDIIRQMKEYEQSRLPNNPQ